MRTMRFVTASIEATSVSRLWYGELSFSSTVLRLSATSLAVSSAPDQNLMPFFIVKLNVVPSLV